MTTHDHIPPDVAHKTVDAVSLLVVGATIVDKLPAIAAIFSIIWALMRITDGIRTWMGLPTVGWLGRPKKRDDAEDWRE
jgi:hypothetical protein